MSVKVGERRGDKREKKEKRSLQIGLRGIRVIIKGVGGDKESVKFAGERKIKI